MDSTSQGLDRRLCMGQSAATLQARGAQGGAHQGEQRAVLPLCQGAGSRHIPPGGSEQGEHVGRGFLGSPLGPQAPTTPHSHTPTCSSLGHVWTSPRPSETETTQKRELQEASHASWFQSCS